jgi:hypothetical protein
LSVVQYGTPYVWEGALVYNRRVYQHTVWCAVYGQYQTYRSSWASTLTGAFCGGDGPAQTWLNSGGNGYSWSNVHSQAPFACDTPWFYKLHDTLWLNVSYNVWGNYAITAANGTGAYS